MIEKRERWRVRMKLEFRCLNCSCRLADSDKGRFFRCSSCRLRESQRARDQRAGLKHPDRRTRVYKDSLVPSGDVPRCRCGLALPCNSCIPSIYAFASVRREGP